MDWKERDELRRLATRATPGPWWIEPERTLHGHLRDAYIAHGTQGDPADTFDLYEGYNVDTDYRYIAALSPEVVIALLDHIDQLERNR